MSRKEFPRNVKVAAIKRATIGGNTICERCGNLAMRFEIDHATPDGLGGEPTLSNAVLLCLPCHREKTSGDVASIAKAKRVEAKHVGATRPKQSIKSRGFAKADKPKHEPLQVANGVPEIARRYGQGE
jgi:5-methylcytosine-specific restriction endonuclease McrA